MNLERHHGEHHPLPPPYSIAYYIVRNQKEIEKHSHNNITVFGSN